MYTIQHPLFENEEFSTRKEVLEEIRIALASLQGKRRRAFLACFPLHATHQLPDGRQIAVEFSLSDIQAPPKEPTTSERKWVPHCIETTLHREWNPSTGEVNESVSFTLYEEMSTAHPRLKNILRTVPATPENLKRFLAAGLRPHKGREENTITSSMMTESKPNTPRQLDLFIPEKPKHNDPLTAF